MYANDKHEVGNPGLPKEKGKNSSSCAGEPYGSEPGNDSEMTDVRGVERQSYSKEAPGKSPVVHYWRILRVRILVASLTAAGKQNDRNNNSRNSVKRISPNNANDEHEVGNPTFIGR